MALKVWLPLNGSLENKGISNNITYALTSGNSFTSGGKISNNALKLTKLQQILETTSCMTGAKEVSYAYWVKVNTAWETNWLDGIRWISTNGTSTATERQEFYTNCTLVGTWYKGGAISGKSFTPGTWTHLAATINYNTGQSCFYINGVLQGSASNVDTTYYCRGDFYIGDNGVDILENDVRIYDHCLSPLEVKEISQGLILHYKLDGFSGGAGENLLINGSLKKRVNGFPNITTYTQTFEEKDGYDCYHIHSDALGKSSSLSWNVKDIINNYPVGTKFVFSGWIKADNITKGTTNYFASLYYGGSYNNNGTSTWIGEGSRIASSPTSNSAFDLSGKGWTYCYIISTFTRNDYTSMGAMYYLRDFTGDIYFRDFKLEVGDKPTSWSPSPEDMGIDTTKIIDSSGYGNDGIVINSLSNIADSESRYGICTEFNGSNTYINAGTGAKVKDEITVAWWGYMDSWSSYKRAISCTENGGWNFESASGKISFQMGTGASSNTYKSCTSSTTWASLASGWHHFVGTYDGLKSNLYIDGVLNKTLSHYTGKTPIYYHSSNSIIIGAEAGSGNAATGNYFNGKLSDIRIYATALSAEDIATLYHTPAQIDNLNNTYSFEFIENDDNYNAITKNGAWNTVAIKERILPEEYTELEYIESSGTQYIDTQIQPCMNTIRCVCDIMPLNNNDTALFGSRGTYYLFYNLANNYFWPTSRCEFSQGTLSIGNKYHVDWNKGILTVTSNGDVMQKGIRTNTTQDTRNMYIFNFNPTDSRSTIARLYYFKIYVNDILQRDFIPCYRNVDQTIGLYDLISNTFFENAGSGVFIPGQKVKENTKYAKILKETKENEAFSFIEK